MFTFTSKVASSALVRAVARGVTVRVVLERKQTDLTTVDEELERSGALLVRGANTNAQYSAMHQKYAILDGHRVITGATNWTHAGTHLNDEDLLIIDSAELALGYRRNFADLLYNYAGLDITASDPALREETPGVAFHAVDADTAFGDAVAVAGDPAALGGWDPTAALPTSAADLFPSWGGHARLAAGTRAEFKLIVRRAAGGVQWEDGANRVVEMPASGRSVVVSGLFGDTGQTWLPKDAPAWLLANAGDPSE